MIQRTRTWMVLPLVEFHMGNLVGELWMWGLLGSPPTEQDSPWFPPEQKKIWHIATDQPHKSSPPNPQSQYITATSVAPKFLFHRLVHKLEGSMVLRPRKTKHDTTHSSCRNTGVSYPMFQENLSFPIGWKSPSLILPPQALLEGFTVWSTLFACQKIMSYPPSKKIGQSPHFLRLPPLFSGSPPLFLLPFWQPPWCVAWWPPHPPAPTPARFAHPPGIAWWVPAGFRCRPRPAPAVVRSRWWGCCACTPRRPGWRWGSWAIDVLGKISKNLEILGKCVNK